MNKRFVFVLAAIAVIFGGAALYMQGREQSERPALAAELGQTLLKNLKADAVASIVIAAPKASLTLAKKAGGWVVVERKDFPADLAKITELVVDAIELKVGQIEPIGAGDRARLDLLAPAQAKPGAPGAATTLSFKSADGKPLAELLLGKQYFKHEAAAGAATASADGRFVMLPDNPNRVYIVSDPLRLASTASADWVSQDGFSVERAKSIELKRADGKGYRIERAAENGAWKLAGAGGARLDAAKANSAAFDLGHVMIDDVAPDTPAIEADLEHPTRVTATTFDGLDYTLRIGKPEQDRYPLRVEVAGTPQREFAARKDEKPDALALRKKAFEAELETLQQRVARERALKDYVLLVPRSEFADLLKTRSDMLQPKTKAKQKP